MSQEIARINGFVDKTEMHGLISSADISTPEKLARFENWKLNDGSKSGLISLETKEKPMHIASFSTGLSSAVNKTTTPTPEEILARAIATYNPSHIFILVSGGSDSTLTAQKTLAYLEEVKHSGPRKVVSLNTLLFADGWPDFVRGHVKNAGWEHDPNKLFYTNPNPGFYEGWVTKYGFPFTPRCHMTMQNRLKGRAVNQIVREHKAEVGTRHRRFDRIMLVTGFRKNESQRRMAATEPIQRNGSQLWVNPLFYYTDEQKNIELFKLGLPMNPYKELIGVSGD